MDHDSATGEVAISAARVASERESWSWPDHAVLPVGDFGCAGCGLIRQEDGTVTISRGDGFVVKIGKWKRIDSTITITSPVVFREIVVIGRAIPEPEVVEQFQDLSNGSDLRLRAADRQFRPLPAFWDFDLLKAVIACDREYYDGRNYLEGPQPCRPTSDQHPQ